VVRSEAEVRVILDRYRQALERSIRVDRLVLYGSYARGDARDDSDIDVIVVSPDFDPKQPLRDQRTLSHATIDVDVSISPIPVAVSVYDAPSAAPTLLDVVRAEGKVVFDHRRAA
jgi:predicted nucleotidyltransferase